MRSLLKVIIFFSVLLRLPTAFGETSSHNVQNRASQSSRSKAIQESQGFTGFAKVRWLDGSLQYLDQNDKWIKTETYYRADKDGTFLNQEGGTVEYRSGDLIFRTPSSGWFKAHGKPPIEREENPLVPNPDGVPLNEVETLIIQFTNEERVKRSLPALKVSGNLQKLTRQKAQNMAKAHNLSHQVPPLPIGGENIAWNQANAKEAVRSWMNSDGHRANILSRRYSTIGAGMSVGNGPYWAQMFQ